MEALVQRFPGARLGVNAVTALVIWGLLTWVNQVIEPLMSYYLATAAMYATAMFGMTILLGLSGQVSLGNGALMAIGGYVFALTSMNWQTVPILGTPWNAVWSMVFADSAALSSARLLVGSRPGYEGRTLRASPSVSPSECPRSPIGSPNFLAEKTA